MTENNNRSLKPEYPEVFYPRILGKVVINAITDEFYTTLQNYAGDDLASDGPFLLWLILSHFHSSTITYQEKLKHQVWQQSLTADHNDDIENYLIWLRHQLNHCFQLRAPHGYHGSHLHSAYEHEKHPGVSYHWRLASRLSFRGALLHTYDPNWCCTMPERSAVHNSRQQDIGIGSYSLQWSYHISLSLSVFSPATWP